MTPSCNQSLIPVTPRPDIQPTISLEENNEQPKLSSCSLRGQPMAQPNSRRRTPKADNQWNDQQNRNPTKPNRY
ncbi:hypothetical protein T4E_360 [Trichinella pseudospiralis]|uniref:Uncharacterized protein n=1 Tax=Trichinella pseudospiralis TaxID=6337 RepID=A0A0V0YLU8_TRIPS|nr:hypothetical protein T4E_360 [Trichinella pseudospiralis]